MPSLIPDLGPAERQRLFDELNYLNMGEIRGFCNRHGIPYRIRAARAAGGSRSTGELDRKHIVLDRVRHYLDTGEVLAETVFPAHVVSASPPPETLRPDDRLYYGWYDKKNPALLEVLGELTGGAFRNGAIARILARELWSRGEAPTLAEYAAAWLEARRAHRGPDPSGAFLSDLARKEAGPDWKAKRVGIARRVLALLDALPAPQRR